MKYKYLSHIDRSKMYYLASPYSHEDELVRKRRYQDIDDIGAELILDGFKLIEPIAMCHPKGLRHNLPTGYTFWQERDRDFIDRCDGIIVAQMEGWDTSEGVTDEIRHARHTGKLVYYFDSNIILNKGEYRAICN